MSEQATIDLGKPRQQAQKERVLEHSKRRLSWARHEVREIARVSASISSFLKDLPASLNDQQTPGKAHNPWSIRQSALNKYLEDKESDRACYGGLNTSAFHRFHASRDLSSLHRSTSDSDQAKKYRFLGNAKELASSEKRANPFKRQGRRLALPVKLRGKTVLALPDTGSDIDAISMDLVKELGLRFYPYSGSKKLVRLSDGHTMTAIGKVSTRLSFAKGPQLRLRRTFYVFSKISTGVELIVGRDFLDHTQTWTRHQDRLSERPIELQGIPKVMNMSVSRRRLPCYIDSCLVLATADTGSEVDLINESYALSRGFKIDPVSEEESYIQLPGQRVAKVTGKVKVKFDTLHDAPPSPNSQKNVSSDDNAQSHLKVEQVIGHARPPSPISDHYRTLYVLPSLTSNVLLGEELLDSIDAFGTHLDSFVDFENLGRGLPDVNSIKWLNSLERKFLNKSSANSTWPPSTLDIHSSDPPIPNLDSIQDFFNQPLEKLNLHTDDHFLAAMSTRQAQEYSRRRRMITHLKGLMDKEQASIDSNEKLRLVAALRDLESRERQAEENYARDKQRCKDSWASWKAWLEASRRNQP